MGERIFVAGLGASGASAVVDLIREVNTFFVFDKELRLFVDPGGLVNLREVLTKNWTVFQSDTAIKNFKRLVKSLSKKYTGNYATLDHTQYFDNKFIELSNRFIDQIISTKFKGFWFGTDNLLIRKINRLSIFYKTDIFKKIFYIGRILTENEFDQLVNDYFNQLINYCLKKYNVQNVFFNENSIAFFPLQILKMVRNSKMILVIRDPRDILATTRKDKWCAAPTKVDKFIQYETQILTRWKQIHSVLKKFDPDNKFHLIIKFSDLIQQYDGTKNKIFEYCNINITEHKDRFRFFNPKKSRTNLGLWKSFLTEYESDQIKRKLAWYYNEYHV